MYINRLHDKSGYKVRLKKKKVKSSFDGNRNHILSDRDETKVKNGRKIRYIVADYIRSGKCKNIETGKVKVEV